MKLSRPLPLIGVLYAGFYLLSLLVESCTGGGGEATTQVPDTYVGSGSCKECHAAAFADWQLSDHYKAMQLPSDSSVLGNFSGSFDGDGEISKFSKSGKGYTIETETEREREGEGGKGKGKGQAFEVKYVLGHYPLQQYIIAMDKGKLQATRLSWDSRNHKWFNQYAGQKIQAGEWLHWTGNGQNYNTMCAACHTTGFNKNYDASKDSYASTWAEGTVGCESCHGPASGHLALVKSAGFSKEQHGSPYGFSRRPDSLNFAELNSCAPCHARKTDVQELSTHSAQLLNDLIPEQISHQNYFADGQIRSEDYELGSFMQSKMYKHNIKCSNCHNVHSGKTLKVGNALCLNCHAAKYDAPQHHHHAQNTEASACINCHMSARTYMGNDVRRDHSFRVPRPDQSMVYETPNACNNCHSKQTAAWASKAVSNWFGSTRAYHFSDDLLPGSRMDAMALPRLLKLVGDTAQPAIARATAIYYLGNMNREPALAAILKALQDKQAIIRYYALRALEPLPAEYWLQKVGACLSDEVKAVRIAAANLYHALPANRIPANYKDAYQLASEENKAFIASKADFAGGQINWANYLAQEGKQTEAVFHYKAALQKDPLLNEARLNLATLQNTLGQNRDALQTLETATQIDPRNARAWYSLGLLKSELKQIPEAKACFEKALALKLVDPSLYYNYGLLLEQEGKHDKAIAVLLQGYALNPNSEKINYALAFIYASQQKHSEALRYIDFLKRVNPQNRDYFWLFQFAQM